MIQFTKEIRQEVTHDSLQIDLNLGLVQFDSIFPVGGDNPICGGASSSSDTLSDKVIYINI